ncbi:uncharacterized protein C8A04DRAFT_30869 [Dichotomopilus funicola]|uniref:Uncharacterized protein n=1 Tax=Dichotomopilus funicola TaxID=1934379 RepID=A0AAN6ZJG1_9PEZI|nr:hypothetical protein C8A04DRAFT_30869 [Dichotomopilus funicola]
MATIVLDGDSDHDESCIVVAGSKRARSREPKVEKQSANAKPAGPPAKRPRGRPRKVKSNTAETAIVLSDTGSDHEEARRQKEKKKVEKTTAKSSPTPARNVNQSPTRSTVTPSAMPADVETLQQQLASERRLRYESETRARELQTIMDDQDASWAASLAAQSMPLQLEMERLTTEKKDLEASCKDLKTRLNTALSNKLGNDVASGHEASNPARDQEQSGHVEMVDHGTITEGGTDEIGRLRDVATSQAKDLAEAYSKVASLTKELEDLTAQHNKTTETIRQHETRIQLLSDELTIARTAAPDNTNTHHTVADPQTQLDAAIISRTQAEEELQAMQARWIETKNTLSVRDEQLAELENRCKDAEEKVRQGLVAMAAKRKDTADILRMKEEQLARSEEILEKVNRDLALVQDQLAAAEQGNAAAETREIINNLHTERNTLLQESQGRLAEVQGLQKKLEELQETLVAYERQNQQLGVHAADQEGLNQQKLAAYHSMISTLQHEKQQSETTVSQLQNELQNVRTLLEEQKRIASSLHMDQHRWTAISRAADHKLINLQRDTDHYREAVSRLQRENDALRAEYTNVVRKAKARESEMRQQLARLGQDPGTISANASQGSPRVDQKVELVVKDDEVMEQLKAKLAQREDDVRHKDSLIITQQQEADDMREDLEAVRSAAAKFQFDANAHLAEIEKLRVVLEEEKKKETATKQAQIEQLQSTIASLNAEMSHYKEGLTAREEELQELHQQLTELTAVNKQLQRTNETHETTIGMMNQNLNAYTAELDFLKAQSKQPTPALASAPVPITPIQCTQPVNSQPTPNAPFNTPNPQAQPSPTLSKTRALNLEAANTTLEALNTALASKSAQHAADQERMTCELKRARKERDEIEKQMERLDRQLAGQYVALARMKAVVRGWRGVKEVREDTPEGGDRGDGEGREGGDEHGEDRGDGDDMEVDGVQVDGMVVDESGRDELESDGMVIETATAAGGKEQDDNGGEAKDGEAENSQKEDNRE